MVYNPSTFKKILCVLLKNKYQFVDFEQFLLIKCRKNKRIVILRHDIDYLPQAAVDIALIEKELGVTGSYFFQVRSPFYNIFVRKNVQAVETISQLGHTVGLHFYTHDLGNVSLRAINTSLNKEYGILSSYFPFVRPVVSFHNPPSELLERISGSTRFGNFVVSYEERFFRKLRYISDSDMSFCFDRFNKSISEGNCESMQLLLHPFLWISEMSSLVKTLKWVYMQQMQSFENALRDENRKWARTERPEWSLLDTFLKTIKLEKEDE